MLASALVLSLVLAGQLSAADNRYPAGGAGQAGTPDITPITPLKDQTDGGSPANSGGFNFDFNTATSPGAPTSPGASAAPASPPAGNTNPLRGSSPTNLTAPRSLPYGSAAQPINAADSSRTTPAVFDAPTASPTAGAAQKRTASDLMRAMLNPPNGSQLRGQRATLVEAVSGARTRAEQTQRVEAYWDLCSSVADYYLGVLEQGELQRFAQRSGQMWEQVDLEIRGRTATSQRAAVASQLRLASLMGRGDGYLPLPADPPHCAGYTTHHDQIFASGAPPEATELAALVPLRYGELKNAADEVTRSEGWLESVISTRGTGEDGFQALKLLALQRRAFVQIARDYNRRIARYAELAAPGPVSPEQLTSMLIKTSASTATKASSPVPPYNRQSNRESSPPSTFVEGSSPAFKAVSKSAKRDDEVRPASRAESESVKKPTSRQEHSVVVWPKPKT
jgi:hypothetical protein